MMWEYFFTAFLSCILMGFVVYKQIKEVRTDGPLLKFKMALLLIGLSIFITSFIGVYFHLSRTGTVPQIFDSSDINRLYSWGRLLKVVMLFLIYWKLT